jgi:hypothetical protein
MAILVVCSGCKARFQVSDQFAGKSGPCPKCKAVIKIPGKTEEVKIHGGEDFSRGGRDAAGKLVLKPIARQETRFNTKTAPLIGGFAVLSVAVAWFGGGFLRQETLVAYLARALGLAIVSPALIIGAYTFLRDDELEAYSGQAMRLRVAICTLAYIVLWGAFGYATERLITGEIWNWLYVGPPFFVVGALVALACFDLDFGNGFFHYSFYVLLTIGLRWIAGMPWPWQVVTNAGT